MAERRGCCSRRAWSPHQAIVLDYSQAEGIEGYREIPDRLAGRERLNIRDEIRLVRRDFYPGRVYFGDRFALNFTLLNPAAVSAGEACPNDQPRR